jgi:hypothetical protein
VGSGWDANPVAQSNPPVNVPGTRYGVYAQDKATTKFSEKNVSAVQSDLKALGYESELVELPTNHPARYIISWKHQPTTVGWNGLYREETGIGVRAEEDFDLSC